MSCVYLREKVVPAIIGKGTCALPGLIALTAVYCGGSKLSCQFPIQLAILEAEPEVMEDELIREAEARMEWLEICDYTDHVNRGRQ